MACVNIHAASINGNAPALITRTRQLRFIGIGSKYEPLNLFLFHADKF
jgi:hypothetical protein